MHDTIIIGAGPAGLTAAIYAARRKMSFALISLDMGGQAAISHDVENYPGLPHVTGKELVENFSKHIEEYKPKILLSEEVLKIEKKNSCFLVKTNKNEYETLTVIITAGKKPRHLGAEGEEEYYNKGVSYCFDCDVHKFEGKKVCIIGGGNSAADSALHMTRIAREIFMVNITKNLTCEPMLKEKLTQCPDIKIFNSSTLAKVIGDSKTVKKVAIKTPEGEKEHDADHVLIQVGLVAGCDFIDFVKKNEKEEIIVNRTTDRFKENMTSAEGIFAAGDVTDVPEKQIIVAAGEGAKAIIACGNYLNRLKSNEKC